MENTTGIMNSTVGNISTEWPLNSLRIPYTILAFIGFSTNLLMIVATLTTESLRTTVNAFILTLSFVDGIYVTFFHTFHAYSMMTGGWIFGTFWCKTVAVVTWYAEGVDFWNIVMVTLNRCFAIVWPIKYHTGILSSKSVVAIMIFIQFALPFVTLIPLLTVVESNSHVGFFKQWGICSIRPFDRFIFLFSNVVNIFVPLGLIAVFYILIIRAIRNNRRRLGDMNLTNEAQRYKTEVQITKLASITVGYYVISYVPFLIARQISVSYSYPSIRWITKTIAVFHRLAWFSNSILYGILNKGYRQAFKRIVCFWRKSTTAQLGIQGGPGPSGSNGKPPEGSDQTKVNSSQNATSMTS